MIFQQEHWFLKDLQYFYLDDGFKLIATTDVPCHLWARMTTTPPLKHALPTYRRGLFMQGDIRFCFVVYEDNEQVEPGDTLTHTWFKSAWPVCETRWFYFIGSIAGKSLVSESPIFKFHFPAPPPEPPPPIDRYFIGTPSNRTVYYTHGVWMMARGSLTGIISPDWADPPAIIAADTTLTVSYWVSRAFMFFDTSGFPSTAIIVSADLNIYVTSWLMTSSVTYPDLYLQPSEQHDPIVATDYGAQRDVNIEIAKKRIDTFIAGQYCPIPFDNDKLTYINTSGITKLCLRTELDRQDRAPPLGSNNVLFHSQQKGAGFYPILKVSYYPA